MNNSVVKTKNVQAFYSGLEVLKKGVRGRLGMMLVMGHPGTGKTFITQKVAMEDDYVYIRCKFIEKPRSLLQSIVAELGEQPSFRVNSLFDQAIDQLMTRPRTIILDEVDYIVDSRIIEIVRDLNDMANTPIIVTGMGHIDKKLQRYPHFFDRIRAVVQFQLFELDEIKLLGREVCEAPIDDSGYDFILQRGQGKFRLTNDLFDMAERIAKRNPQFKAITSDHLSQSWSKEKQKERRA